MANVRDSISWTVVPRVKPLGMFVKFGDIEMLAWNGVEVLAPVPKPRNASRDRHAPQDDDGPAMAEWRQRMGQGEAKEIYKQRVATAECANAQARNRGLTQFLVRSVAKVKTVALWHQGNRVNEYVTNCEVQNLCRSSDSLSGGWQWTARRRTVRHSTKRLSF
jgi:hypothetical protein